MLSLPEFSNLLLSEMTSKYNQSVQNHIMNIKDEDLMKHRREMEGWRQAILMVAGKISDQLGRDFVSPYGITFNTEISETPVSDNSAPIQNDTVSVS